MQRQLFNLTTTLMTICSSHEVHLCDLHQAAKRERPRVARPSREKGGGDTQSPHLDKKKREAFQTPAHSSFAHVATWVKIHSHFNNNLYW